MMGAVIRVDSTFFQPIMGLPRFPVFASSSEAGQMSEKSRLSPFASVRLYSLKQRQLSTDRRRCLPDRPAPWPDAKPPSGRPFQFADKLVRTKRLS